MYCIYDNKLKHEQMMEKALIVDKNLCVIKYEMKSQIN